MKTLDPSVLCNDGYLQEVNRGFFHPLGLALAVNEKGELSVLDMRDDSEGFIFDDDQNLEPKAARLAEIREARRPAREKALGYWQQPEKKEAD